MNGRAWLWSNRFYFQKQVLGHILPAPALDWRLLTRWLNSDWKLAAGAHASIFPKPLICVSIEHQVSLTPEDLRSGVRGGTGRAGLREVQGDSGPWEG